MKGMRFLSMFLCAALLLTLLPVTALAADGTISAGGTYDLLTYGSGSTITIDTTERVTLRGDGPVLMNVKINCVAAGVDLTLVNVSINNTTPNACPLSFTGPGNTLTLAGSMNPASRW